MLLDTSAWIEFLRATGSGVHLRVRDAIREGSVAITDPVTMELVAGARDAAREQSLRALTARAERVACTLEDYLVAGRIHRACRRGGEPVRNQVDCLIAAVAIRARLPVLHADRDFATIARYSNLQLA
jgi:predicted nucleic acid-binding protein